MIYLLGARVVGPLAPYVVGYCGCLAHMGFSEATRAHHVSVVAHLSRWLAGEDHGAGDLTAEVAHPVHQLQVHRPPARRRHRCIYRHCG